MSLLGLPCSHHFWMSSSGLGGAGGEGDGGGGDGGGRGGGGGAGSEQNAHALHEQKGQWTWRKAALQYFAHARVVLPLSIGLQCKLAAAVVTCAA